MASLRTAVRRLSVLARYDAAIASGLKPDPEQRAAPAEHSRLHEQVTVYASTLGGTSGSCATGRRCVDATKIAGGSWRPRRRRRRRGGRRWSSGQPRRCSFSPPPAAQRRLLAGQQLRVGRSCASAELDGLSTEERRHPFWTSGLGSSWSSALRRRRHPTAEVGRRPPTPLPPARPTTCRRSRSRRSGRRRPRVSSSTAQWVPGRRC